MYARWPKVIGTAKKRYSMRNYFGNIWPISKVLHQDILVKGRIGSSAYATIWLSGCKKIRGTKKGWLEVWILQFPGKNAPTNISSVSISMESPMENPRCRFVGESAILSWSIGNFMKYLLVAKLLVLSDCSVLQKLFEAEANGNPNCYSTNS